MRRIIISSLVAVAFLTCSYKPQPSGRLEVYWYIKTFTDQNQPLDLLSSNILTRISKGELIAIDTNSERKMSKDEVLYRLAPAQKCFLSKEEVEICLRVGDFSVMQRVESKYSANKLHKMINDGQDISQKFSLKSYSSFEVTCLETIIHEHIEVLDTLSGSQKGRIKYLILCLPGFINPDKKSIPIFRIKYEDFLKYGQESEKKFIEDRQFKIFTSNSELEVAEEQTGKRYKLSDSKGTDESSLVHSVFRYLKENIVFK